MNTLTLGGYSYNVVQRSLFLYRLLFLLFVYSVAIRTSGQSRPLDTNKVEIEAARRIYTDAENLLIISSTYVETNEGSTYTISHPLKSIVVQASQGNIRYAQPSIYYLSGLKAGTVKVKVFRPVDTGLLLLTYKTFQVQKRQLTLEEKKFIKLKVKPEICIGGYSSGDIPISCIRKATKLEVNPPFKFKRAMLYVASKGFDGLSLAEVLSDRFDENVKRLLDRARIGNTIAVDEITVVDEKGTTYHLKSIAFKVIADDEPASN
jgi:hypothetical protein